MLDELERIVDLAQRGRRWVTMRELERIEHEGTSLPIHGITVGPDDPSLPTLGLFGGVHGLERIGAHVVIHVLEVLVSRLAWDSELRDQLSRARIVAIPAVNPQGMLRRTRSNAKGVDLMRNAPVDAGGKVTWLVGGHRMGPWLPWFRGVEGAEMEREAQVLIDFVRAELFHSEFAISLDVHSGFGSVDRLWYPYARAPGEYPREPECLALGARLTEYEPHHVYTVEPQAQQYTTHGDLWDHVFDLHRSQVGTNGGLYLPWTLEMGSWVWIRKNPWQIFDALGAFNPIKPHRYGRTMRRHARLVEFLWSVLLSGRDVLSGSRLDSLEQSGRNDPLKTA
jgi:hypothetical protein